MRRRPHGPTEGRAFSLGSRRDTRPDPLPGCRRPSGRRDHGEPIQSGRDGSASDQRSERQCDWAMGGAAEMEERGGNLRICLQGSAPLLRHWEGRGCADQGLNSRIRAWLEPFRPEMEPPFPARWTSARLCSALSSVAALACQRRSVRTSFRRCASPSLTPVLGSALTAHCVPTLCGSHVGCARTTCERADDMILSLGPSRRHTASPSTITLSPPCWTGSRWRAHYIISRSESASCSTYSTCKARATRRSPLRWASRLAPSLA